ncbi:MAG TPA: 2-amino-4-hydroxy-6-hydroxymethyldihydropteridine diphosphokinase [Chloroflexota bacterium]|nr:2-amino-4-hydroxy-6-hydroxymethyldihydropteridine diphosphokinase [Chloroflexota bacterium]
MIDREVPGPTVSRGGFLHPVYVGLGSNLGDRLANLRAAAIALASRDRVCVRRVSSVYETSPWGRVDQPWYLNAVVECASLLGPFELLATLKGIESDLGRLPGPRWGPRLIDLDLLVFKDLYLRSPTLVVPHRDLPRRAFVLAPLDELAPNVRLSDGSSVVSRLTTLAEEQSVRRYGQPIDDWLESASTDDCGREA